MSAPGPAPAPLEADPLADVVPFSELPKIWPALFPRRHSAYWLLRRRKANGLDGIVKFIGRTAFVSRSEFATWFKSRTA